MNYLYEFDVEHDYTVAFTISDFNGQLLTLCNIIDLKTGMTIGAGHTVLHDGDAFDAAIGMKLALARALHTEPAEFFDKGTRTLIWDSFWDSKIADQAGEDYYTPKPAQRMFVNCHDNNGYVYYGGRSAFLSLFE